MNEMRSASKLQRLCIKNNWFTCGTNRQYEKLFKQLEKGASYPKLAIMIWICSDEELIRTATLEEIERILRENGF